MKTEEAIKDELRTMTDDYQYHKGYLDALKWVLRDKENNK